MPVRSPDLIHFVLAPHAIVSSVFSSQYGRLTVLLSIVLGLAITQVLLWFRGLILTRAKVKLYTPTLIWAVSAFPTLVQAWWADFECASTPNWTFFALLVIMLQAISLYMVAALILPDITGEDFVDLREHFFAHRSWFFGALLASVFYKIRDIGRPETLRRIVRR